MGTNEKILFAAVNADQMHGPYREPTEHLGDLMRRLDLLILREVVRHRNSKEPADSWMGFVAISEKEVDGFLRQPLGSQSDQESSAETMTIDRELERLDSHIQRREGAALQAGVPLPLAALAGIFRLLPVEIDALLICLAPELDRRYERLYGYLHDDMGRKRASTGLILNLCQRDFAGRTKMRSIFSPRSPLTKYRLIKPADEAGDGNTFISRPLRLDERIISFIMGEPGVDPEIKDALEWAPPEQDSSTPHSGRQAVIARLMTALEKCSRDGKIFKKPLFYLHGNPKTGKAGVAREISRRLGAPLLSVDAEELEASPAGFKNAVFLVFREGLLSQATVLIRNIDKIIENDRGRTKLKFLMKYVEEMAGVTFLCGEKPWSWPVPEGPVLFLPVQLTAPGFEEQLGIWKSAFGENDAITEVEAAAFASKYPSTTEKVREAVQVARNFALSRSGKTGVDAEDIEQALGTRNIPDLGPLAQRIDPRHRWDDLVLPADQTGRLREICSHITHRVVVYGTWGFGKKISLGKGLNVLFCGPPGTGKTMAAEVLAHELRLGLYKIDLSQVVSKYIGETEKNLHQIFREAQASHAILFFDEADALLGKRSDVKDSHDRYANLEIAYLLQKMEEYEGVTILATNLRQNMDEAFTRRIRFIIEFPFPEEDSRLRIWKGIWPKETPLAENVDLEFLAKKFKLAGGNIRNIALASSFLASSDGSEVDMKHLLKVTKQEFLKMGRLVDESEFA